MDAKELRRIVKMLRLGNDITEYAESKLLLIADDAESKQLIQSCVVGQSEQLSKRPNTSSTMECFNKKDKQQK